MSIYDKYNREFCPVCRKPLPISIVKVTGEAVVKVYCRKCKSVLSLTLEKKT